MKTHEDEWFAASWPLMIVFAAAIVWLCVLGLPPEPTHERRVDAWLNTPPALRGEFPKP